MKREIKFRGLRKDIEDIKTIADIDLALQLIQTELCDNLDENYKCKNMCLTRCVNGNNFIGDVSSSADLKVGDKIDIGGFVTELKEIKYDPYSRTDLYWFYNERGEYKFNVREWITVRFE